MNSLLKDRLIYLLILFLLFSSSCVGTKKESNNNIHVPKGWYISINNSELPLIKAVENKPGYKLKIDRSALKSKYAYYIQIAESLYPEQSMIRTEQLKKNITISNASKQVWYFERVWWAEEFGKKLIPYSLTSDTLDKYIKYYIGFKKQLKTFKARTDEVGDNRYRIRFNYTAKATQPNPKNPKVIVVLKMSWYQHCGFPCGWGFKKHRIVVFDNKYHISRITGDGVPKKWVSNPDNLYGEEWYFF